MNIFRYIHIHGQSIEYFLCVIMRHIVCVGEKGRWNAYIYIVLHDASVQLTGAFGGPATAPVVGNARSRVRRVKRASLHARIIRIRWEVQYTELCECVLRD
jgi:hypothetical protein